jgi:hypothetical protein
MDEYPSRYYRTHSLGIIDIEPDCTWESCVCCGFAIREGVFFIQTLTMFDFTCVETEL